MCSERRVVMPDGSVHVERTFGNVRYDLTTGLATTVISAPSSTMSQVVRPDGTVAMETVVGVCQLVFAALSHAGAWWDGGLAACILAVYLTAAICAMSQLFGLCLAALA